MHTSLRGSRLAGLAALGFALGACTTDGDEPSTPPAAGDPESLPLLCADCEHLNGVVAGGESSEFSGGNPLCDIAVSAPRPLSDPELAPMLDWIEGRRELSLRWRPNFVTDRVSGYEERTQVELDVRAMGARDVTLESGCTPNRELLLDLAVDVATADGALRGTFTQTVRLLHGDDQFQTNLLQGDSISYPLDDFRGSLRLDFNLARRAGGVVIQLAFSPAGVRGRLMPIASSPAAYDWAPLEGHFPDDGCGFASWPAALDQAMGSLNGETLGDAFERQIDPWRGPVPAVWSSGEQTEVSLDIGAPEQACQALLRDSGPYANAFRLNAPLRVASADGRLDVSGTAVFAASAHGVELPFIQVGYDAPFVPLDDMLQVSGIGHPTPDPGALYARPGLHMTYADGGGLFNGNFHVETWPPDGANQGEQWVWW